ncbi:MAG: PAS domain-containing protein [Sulfurimonas sp.]|jgi:PAS domain S-box-containing protein|nr:PAS domain-containing protein [Sulfurimonas sp.]
MLKEMKKNDFIISKTNLKGQITYTNKIFMEMSEYSEAELLDKPHSLLRHPQMPKAVFQHLWNHITKQQEVFAYVLNKTKHNNEYWVYANITASLDENDKHTGYYSVRRAPNPKALEIIKPLYAKMLEIEKRSGVNASMNVLVELLKEKGVCYDEFIISIQE